jgi:predicted nucleic acid-binding protein
MEGHQMALNVSRFLLATSVISEIELLGKKNLPLPEINTIRNLLNDCKIIKLTDEIKEIAISLKQKYSVKTPDAIIAATAKRLDLSLITADIDLKKIEDVDIILLDLI